MNADKEPGTVAQWNRALAAYARPSTSKSMLQLATTLALFCAVMAAACFLSLVSPLMGVPMAMAAGILLVKVFIIQHDCGHRSYFKSRVACDAVGRCLSLLTLVPYGYWRKDHDKHHATSGNLDKRGHGDIDMLTVGEWTAAGTRERILYRLYRNPVVLLGIGPAWQFLLRYRLPIGLGKRGRMKAAMAILGHDAALAGLLVLAALLVGWQAVAAVWLPAVLTAGSVGVWLFYVQHCFEHAYWEQDERWSFVDASLKGCSYYRLPAFLHWLTGNIGYHHVHHLSARIPNYNLPAAHREVSRHCEVPSLGVIESIGTLGLALWCEQRRRMVSFREAASAI